MSVAAFSQCPQCAKAIRGDSQFCHGCGLRLSDLRLPEVSPRLPEVALLERPATNSARTVMVPKDAAYTSGRSPSGPTPPVPPARPPSVPTPPLPLVGESSATQICASCGMANPQSMNFCKMCGTPFRLAGRSSDLRPVAMPSPLTAVGGSLPRAAAGPTRSCSHCGGQTPAAFAYCQHCGVRVGVVAPAAADELALRAADDATADTLAGDQEIVPLVKRRSDTANRAPRIVSVLRDGTDGDSHELIDDIFDIGRTEAQLRFVDDRFLAPRHARLERRGAVTVLIPLDSMNGVYLRLRDHETHDLLDGDYLLLGKEVLCFEAIAPEERSLAPLVQGGVRLFGSPHRPPWGRLRQIVQTGATRDIFHLASAEVVLGREEGDLRFPDDEFMSRRHARLTNHDGRFELSDLGSSNGSFVRLRGERVLHVGDRLRLGDQLFRFMP